MTGGASEGARGPLVGCLGWVVFDAGGAVGVKGGVFLC